MERIQDTAFHQQFWEYQNNGGVRRRCGDIQQVVCPEYLTKNHQNIDSVHWGDQLWEHGGGLSSKVNFQK